MKRGQNMEGSGLTWHLSEKKRSLNEVNKSKNLHKKLYFNRSNPNQIVTTALKTPTAANNKLVKSAQHSNEETNGKKSDDKLVSDLPKNSLTNLISDEFLDLVKGSEAKHNDYSHRLEATKNPLNEPRKISHKTTANIGKKASRKTKPEMKRELKESNIRHLASLKGNLIIKRGSEKSIVDLKLQKVKITEPKNEGNYSNSMSHAITPQFVLEEMSGNSKKPRSLDESHVSQGNLKKFRSEDSLDTDDSEAMANMKPLTEAEEAEFDRKILQLGHEMKNVNTSTVIVDDNAIAVDKVTSYVAGATGTAENEPSEAERSGGKQQIPNELMNMINEKFERLEKENFRLAAMLETQSKRNETNTLNFNASSSGAIRKTTLTNAQREFERHQEFLHRREYVEQQQQRRTSAPYVVPSAVLNQPAPFTNAMKQASRPSSTHSGPGIQYVNPNTEGTSEMILIPSNYPYEVVTDDLCKRSEKLLNSMSTEMDKRGGINIAITGIRHKQGAMIVTCNNRGTVEWLKRIAPVGLQLMAFKPSNVKLRKAFNLWIPCDRTDWDDAILVISKQGIRVDDWHLLKKYSPQARPNGSKFLFLGDSDLDQRTQQGQFKIQFKFHKIQAAITQLATVDLHGTNSHATGKRKISPNENNSIKISFKTTLQASISTQLKRLRTSHANWKSYLATRLLTTMSNKRTWSNRNATVITHHPNTHEFPNDQVNTRITNLNDLAFSHKSLFANRIKSKYCNLSRNRVKKLFSHLKCQGLQCLQYMNSNKIRASRLKTEGSLSYQKVETAINNLIIKSKTIKSKIIKSKGSLCHLVKDNKIKIHYKNFHLSFTTKAHLWESANEKADLRLVRQVLYMSNTIREGWGRRKNFENG